MRGEVLFYNEADGDGMVSGEDGVRYPFRRSDLQTLTAIRAGSRVDFVPQDGAASGCSS